MRAKGMSDTTTTADFARLDQAMKIVQLYADATRKQQAVRLAPWALAFMGMTAGAALLAIPAAVTAS